jgi:hypothetical protein
VRATRSWASGSCKTLTSVSALDGFGAFSRAELDRGCALLFDYLA